MHVWALGLSCETSAAWSGAPPFGAPPFGAPPFGPPFWAGLAKISQLRLAQVGLAKVGRSRNSYSWLLWASRRVLQCIQRSLSHRCAQLPPMPASLRKLLPPTPTSKPCSRGVQCHRTVVVCSFKGSGLLHWLQRSNFPPPEDPLTRNELVLDQPLAWDQPLTRNELVLDQPLAWDQPTSKWSVQHHPGQDGEQFPPSCPHVNVPLHSTLHHCLASQPPVETSHAREDTLHDDGSPG